MAVWLEQQTCSHGIVGSNLRLGDMWVYEQNTSAPVEGNGELLLTLSACI